MGNQESKGKKNIIKNKETMKDPLEHLDQVYPR